MTDGSQSSELPIRTGSTNHAKDDSASRPRRRFPPVLADSLLPNSEYSRFGNYLFELYGSHEDGTLAVETDMAPGHEEKQRTLLATKYKDVLDEIPRRPPQTRPELPPPSWPLTHRDRISELHRVLEEPFYAIHHENVKAAIRYHESFDPDELCEPDIIEFSGGKRWDRTVRPMGPIWIEGCVQQYMNQQ